VQERHTGQHVPNGSQTTDHRTQTKKDHHSPGRGKRAAAVVTWRANTVRSGRRDDRTTRVCPQDERTCIGVDLSCHYDDNDDNDRQCSAVYYNASSATPHFRGTSLQLPLPAGPSASRPSWSSLGSGSPWSSLVLRRGEGGDKLSISPPDGVVLALVLFLRPGFWVLGPGTEEEEY
jgi:hypothetical protein